MRPKKNGNDFAPQNMHPTKSIYNVSRSFINIAPTAPTHCCCCSLFFGGIHCFKKMYQKTRGKNFALTCFDGNYRAWWRALFHCSNPVRKNVVVWLCTLAIARVCYRGRAVWHLHINQHDHVAKRPSKPQTTPKLLLIHRQSLEINGVEHS